MAAGVVAFALVASPAFFAGVVATIVLRGLGAGVFVAGARGGGDLTGTGSRARESDAAVGCDRRSLARGVVGARSAGVAAGGGALRDFASDEAVGTAAAGVFGRVVEGVLGRADGVLGLAAGGAVFGTAGLAGVAADPAREAVRVVPAAEPPVCCGLSGAAAGKDDGGPRAPLADLAVAAAAVVLGLEADFATDGGRAPAAAVAADLLGVAGVVALVAAGFAGAGAAAGAGGGDIALGGGGETAAGGEAADATSGFETALGGHSRFSRWSPSWASRSRAYSDVTDDTRGLLGGEWTDDRLTCCSNLPIRFATLCRGRSSGSGIVAWGRATLWVLELSVRR